jgi:hypothetical protein
MTFHRRGRAGLFRERRFLLHGLQRDLRGLDVVLVGSTRRVEGLRHQRRRRDGKSDTHCCDIYFFQEVSNSKRDCKMHCAGPMDTRAMSSEKE